MDRTINLTEDQVKLLEQLLSSTKEDPKNRAIRERAESIDAEIYSLAEIHEKLLDVINNVIPDTEDGKVIKPLLVERLDVALQAQMGRKIIERDIILQYTEEEFGEMMEREMMLDYAADWMSFFARRARENLEENPDNAPIIEDEEPVGSPSNTVASWFQKDKFAVALLGVVGGGIAGALGSALTFGAAIR